MSRNVGPSLTASSDFGPLIPMLVPRPPLSFTTTVRSSASRAMSSSSGSSAASGSSSTGSISDSGSAPFPRAQALEVVRERRDARVRDTVVAHLAQAGLELVVGHRADPTRAPAAG